MIKKGKKQCHRYLGSNVSIEELLRDLAECGVATGGNNAKLVIHKDYENCYECSGGTSYDIHLQWEEDFTPKEIDSQMKDLESQKEKSLTRRKRDWARLKKEFGA